MKKTFRTSAVAKTLDASYWQLMGLFRSNRMAKPPKDPLSGDLVWSSADVRTARRLLEEGRQSRGTAKRS